MTAAALVDALLNESSAKEWMMGDAMAPLYATMLGLDFERNSGTGNHDVWNLHGKNHDGDRWLEQHFWVSVLVRPETVRINCGTSNQWGHGAGPSVNVGYADAPEFITALVGALRTGASPHASFGAAARISGAKWSVEGM